MDRKKKKKKILQDIKSRFEFGVAIVAIKTLMLFKEESRFKFATFLAKVGFSLVKKRKAIAFANLKLAFPKKSQEEIEEIALKSYINMSKAFLSTMWFEEYLKNRVSLEGLEKLDANLEKKSGVMVALMHLGNMEAGLKVGDFHHITTVAKKQRNVYLDEYITRNREKANVTVIKKSKSTTRDLIKAFKEDTVYGLFSDHRDKGAEVTFFGRKTVSPTGPVSLAIKYNMPLMLSYNILLDDNSCKTTLIDIPVVKNGNFKEDVLLNTQILIDHMEDIIRKYPDQWMWFHDRWKLSKEL